MKKTTKILSVFLALMMVFSCMPMTAFAAGRDTSSLSAYLENDNLADAAETLLTDLGKRKEALVPTALKLCFQLIKELKQAAESDGVDVMRADTETLAKELIAVLDKALADADLNSQIKDYKFLISIVLKTDIDLNSVNGVLATLVGVMDMVHSSNVATWGDIYSLNVETLKKGKEPISTKNTSNLGILYGLIDFLSDAANIKVIKKVIKGNFDLGAINGTIKSIANMDIEAMVNDTMRNLDGTINELIYNELIADKETVTDKDGSEKEVIKVAFADSDYADYNSDELLASALIKWITSADVRKDEAAKAASMTIYELIGAYADIAVANFLIEPLNTTVKEELKKLIESDDQLKVLNDIVNLNYEFTKDTFRFSELAEDGLFENLNNIVCRIIEVIAQPAVYQELGLKTGGNENITQNLTSFFGFVFKTLAGNNGGKLEFTLDDTKYSYDFSGFTAENLKDKSLEDMVVAVLALFYPTWFGTGVPADVNNLEKLAVYTAYTAIDTFMVRDSGIDFIGDYKELIFHSDGTAKDLTKEEAADAVGTMGMDVAIYWLNRSTDIGIDQDKVAELKSAGWTWEDFFEEIVDWALNYIDGIPAVADHLDTTQGEIDEFCNTAWYKLNVVLNELFPLGFINGCSDATFTFDTRTFVMEKAVPGLLDCDFAAFADILSMNENPENPFHQSVISSAVAFLDHLLFSLFEHTCGETATTMIDGYKVTYDTKNGHYISVVNPDEPEKPTEPAPTVKKGDVNDDGKVTAVDARLTLRCVANLERLTQEQQLAADVDGKPGVGATDARIILRVAANLESLPK